MGSVVDSIFGGGGDGAGAARDASQLQAQYQREALDYLKQQERLPSAYREGALSILGGLYGLQAPAPQPASQQQINNIGPLGRSGPFGDLVSRAGELMGPPPGSYEQFAAPPMYNENSFMGSRMNQRAAEQQAAQQQAAQQQSAQQQQPAAPAQTGMSQEDALAAIMNNPIYQAALGDIGAQEESILRNQAATGALRGAGTEQMLAENQRLNQYQALQASLGGLQGLSGLPSNAGAIAQQTAGIGQTLGQGIIGAAQSEQASQQAGFSNLMGLGQLGLAGFAAFCDPSLKSNAKRIGASGGYQIYRWTWNDKAAELGLVGEGVGPMADEIEKFEPERIEIRNGYKYVRAAS